MVASSSTRLQQLLQSAVQSVQWTYSLFWQLCPQQGILVWGDGYYNGAIKTRKMVEPMEVSAEEALLHRSQQLRELYDYLSAGEGGQPARRPCAALSPEDLTKSEWYYLMCVSFSFQPGIGLPGKAFTKRRHVWLTRANEADSKVFTRAILAKSAHIQTVVCIPLLDGVLELGTTEKVEEHLGLIQRAKSFFTDYLDHQHKPALSEHSTSNSVACIDQSLLLPQPLAIPEPVSMNLHGSNQDDNDDDDDDDDDGEEDNDDDEDNDDGDEADSDSEAEMGRYDDGISTQSTHPTLTVDETAISAAEQSDLMQIEMSEGIRLASPDDCSNNLDSELQMIAMDCTNCNQSDLQRDDSYQAWHFLHEDLCNGFSQSSGAAQIQDLSPEDAHYSKTVSSILQQKTSQWADSSSIGHPSHSQQSTFSKWNYGEHTLPVPFEGTSQWVLKYILFSIPNLHCKYKDENSPKSIDGAGGSRFRKGIQQEELSANHVLAERRRREKLNERFIILRSLVPFVTKMDKASILGDTIEYVKQLRRHIQDLEERTKQMEINTTFKETEIQRPSNSKDQIAQKSSSTPKVQHVTFGRNRDGLSDKRKLRVVEGDNGTAKVAKAMKAPNTNVQVSIIETDALVELQCPYKDGLLLKIMQTFHELRLEITSIQSSSANSTFVAKLRAKVKEIHGKKASIATVKKAIHQIFSH